MDNNTEFITCFDSIRDVVLKSSKIIVLGSPGSGKTYFSKNLAKLYAFDIYHWDDLYWKAGWVRTPDDIIIEKINEILKKPRWILDGNYFHYAFKERLISADAVFLLNINSFICVYRILIRYLKILLGNNNMLPVSIRHSDSFCLKKVHYDFNFLKFVASFNKKTLPQMLEIARHFQKKVYVLNRQIIRKAVKEFSHG